MVRWKWEAIIYAKCKKRSLNPKYVYFYFVFWFIPGTSRSQEPHKVTQNQEVILLIKLFVSIEAWKLSHQSFYPSKNHQSVTQIIWHVYERKLKIFGGIQNIWANKVINLYVDHFLCEILIKYNTTTLDDHHEKNRPTSIKTLILPLTYPIRCMNTDSYKLRSVIGPLHIKRHK